jgi:hypothetical protein
MAPTDPACAPEPRNAPVRWNRAAALTLSIAAHVVLLYVASRAPWIVDDTENRAPPAVVWLGDWAPVEHEQQAVPELPTEPPESPVVSPSSSERSAPETPATDTPPERPARALSTVRAPDVTVPDQAAESDVERNRAEPAAPAARAPDAPDSADDVLPGIDWEAERRSAIRQLSERREREESYLTFSTDDLIEQTPSEDSLEPRPEKSVFESSRGGGRAALPYGRSRGKVGRFVSELCHALTGGFGLFGMSVCAEDNARSDLFAHIKPDYLKKRPVCEEVPIMLAQLADVTSDGEPETAMKCRLVAKDE